MTWFVFFAESCSDVQMIYKLERTACTELSITQFCFGLFWFLLVFILICLLNGCTSDWAIFFLCYKVHLWKLDYFSVGTCKYYACRTCWLLNSWYTLSCSYTFPPCSHLTLCCWQRKTFCCSNRWSTLPSCVHKQSMDGLQSWSIHPPIPKRNKPEESKKMVILMGSSEEKKDLFSSSTRRATTDASLMYRYPLIHPHQILIYLYCYPRTGKDCVNFGSISTSHAVWSVAPWCLSSKRLDIVKW